MKENSMAMAGKYLTFNLGEEEYGVPIEQVKEIIGMMAITGMPQMPPFVKGVINLRDQVISIIDLRLKFSMPETTYTERTCIIVIELHGLAAGAQTTVGVIVDSVSEVASITEEQVEPAPQFSAAEGASQIIRGMAKMTNGVKILLDIDRALSSEDLIALCQPAHV